MGSATETADQVTAVSSDTGLPLASVTVAVSWKWLPVESEPSGSLISIEAGGPGV